MSRRTSLDADTLTVLEGMTHQWKLDWPSIAHNSAHFGSLMNDHDLSGSTNEVAQKTREFVWGEMQRLVDKSTDVENNGNLLVLLGAIAILMREAASLYTTAARMHFIQRKEVLGVLTEENVLGSMFLLSLSMALETHDYTVGSNDGSDDDEDDN